MPLLDADLPCAQFYFERQGDGSDTCGLNALNNICQRPQFRLEDLILAEEERAFQQRGGSFVNDALPHRRGQKAVSGFFDVEALKLAAGKVDLEIVDVEPRPSSEESACKCFVDAARGPELARGSWFLGFLVHDRRPGRPMHYYVLRRNECDGSWLKLDSLQGAANNEAGIASANNTCKNRHMSEEELWNFYDANGKFFASWLLRWYPVVYKPGAVQALRSLLPALCPPDNAVGAPCSLTVSDICAERTLRECGWVVTEAAALFLQNCPREQ